MVALPPEVMPFETAQIGPALLRSVSFEQLERPADVRLLPRRHRRMHVGNVLLPLGFLSSRVGFLPLLGFSIGE